MEFSITTKEPDDFTLSKGIPPGYISYAVNGSTGYSAFGRFGKILFQKIEGEGFTIRASNYFIEKDTCFFVHADKPLPELHFVFNNGVKCFLEGIGESLLTDGQFNLTYTPILQSQVTLYGRNQYCTFDIHFDYSFLQKFSGGSPELSIFLGNIQKGDAGTITPQPHFATAGMMAVISSILKNKYHGKYGRLFIESQVVILLLQVLEKIAKDQSLAGSIRLSGLDIERIVAARDYLIEHMDDPVSIMKLARIAGINDFKLKKGFKQLFGSTIFKYLENARLDKAMNLVKETEMSIAEIGFSLGYLYPTHFSAVFKKKFGYPPSHFKK